MEFEKHLGLFEKPAPILYRVPHQLVELQPLALKSDLISRDPDHVKKVVDQPGELIDLSLNDSLGSLRLLSFRGCTGQDVQAVLDGSQRISQLLRKQSQDLMLALIGLGELEVGRA